MRFLDVERMAMGADTWSASPKREFLTPAPWQCDSVPLQQARSCNKPKQPQTGQLNLIEPPMSPIPVSTYKTLVLCFAFVVSPHKTAHSPAMILELRWLGIQHAVYSERDEHWSAVCGITLRRRFHIRQASTRETMTRSAHIPTARCAEFCEPHWTRFELVILPSTWHPEIWSNSHTYYRYPLNAMPILSSQTFVNQRDMTEAIKSENWKNQSRLCNLQGGCTARQLIAYHPVNYTRNEWWKKYLS